MDDDSEQKSSPQNSQAKRSNEAQVPPEYVPLLDQADFFTVKPNELRALGMLGKGAQAHVYKAEWTRAFGACTSSIIVAVKRLHQKLGVMYRDREVLTLKTDHPNLVKCFDCTLEKPYLIVNEFCAGGSLFDLIYNSKRELSIPQIIKCLADIADGMSFLHEQEPAILHRDLKSSNVLLMKPIRTSSQIPYAKVADFGLARASRDGPDDSMMTIGVGTWRWMAPEVFETEGTDEDPYDTRVDVFSFAMVIYECLTRRLPYVDHFPTDRPDPRIGLRVCQGLRPNVTKVRGDSPPELIDIMQRSWDDDRAVRPPFSESKLELHALLQATTQAGPPVVATD